MFADCSDIYSISLYGVIINIFVYTTPNQEIRSVWRVPHLPRERG